MFLHLIDVFLAESFNLVSNVWHVEMARCVEVFVLKSCSISIFELEALSHSWTP